MKTKFDATPIIMMTVPEVAPPKSLLRLLLGAASVVVLLAAMYFAAAVVNLVLLALIITLLALPLLHWIERHGLSFRVSYLLVLLVIIVVAVSILLIGGLSLAQAVANVPTYLQQFQSQLAHTTSSITPTLREVEPLSKAANAVVALVLGVLVSVLASGLSLVIGGVFLLLIVAFMLVEADSFGGLVRRTVGADNPHYRRVADSTQAVTTYMGLTAGVNLLIAAGDVVLLWLLGVPNPLLWGIVSFVFGFIPYIGYWVSFIPPFILAFSSGGTVPAFVVLVGYALINGVVSQVVAPRLYGQSLNLSITLTVVAVIFWGALLGPVGGMLAVPLTAIIKSALLANYPETAWLATILGHSRGEKQ